MINHPPEKLLTKHLKNSPKFSPKNGPKKGPKNGPKNSPKNMPKVQRSNGPIHILPYALMHHLCLAALYQSTRRLNFVCIRPRTEQEITKSLISSRLLSPQMPSMPRFLSINIASHFYLCLQPANYDIESASTYLNAAGNSLVNSHAEIFCLQSRIESIEIE